MWDNKTITVKAPMTEDMMKMELKADVLELADLKVDVLELADLRVNVLDLADLKVVDFRPAVLRVAVVDVADLMVTGTKGAEILMIAARMMLLNTIWSSLLHLECDSSMQTLFNRL